ncbi:helix-turn-helix transcriptional regulator [bacterium]|nr:helix-turn-helix transcriptional regulator [bacterium]
MSRKKTEINPIRAERVKKIIDREGISQIDFSKRIFQTQQNVSRIINLKTALTEETAHDIISAFPEYRIEWLLGYDDAMTDIEWADNVQEMKDRVADSMWGIIEKSLNKEGKSLKFVHRSGQHVDSSERLRADCYYSVVDREGNELKRLTALEMVQFEQKIQEYCDFMTGKYL